MSEGLKIESDFYLERSLGNELFSSKDPVAFDSHHTSHVMERASNRCKYSCNKNKSDPVAACVSLQRQRVR